MSAARQWRISGGRVVTPAGVIAPGEVVIRGERLVAVGPYGAFGKDPGEKVVSADGCWVIPGFIDLHFHGAVGADVMDASAASLLSLSLFHARHGTTAFLATTVSAPREELREVVRRAAAWSEEGDGGARLLGVHLEGPYLNPAYAGAQPSAWLRPPDREEMADLLAIAPGCVKMVTLAPELPGALELIGFLRQQKVVVAAGHTGATFAQARPALRAGLSHVTHLFNAMRPLHQREPGLAGLALAEPVLGFSLIADGVHVHPAMLKIALGLPRRGCPVLISDALPLCGRDKGTYTWCGRRVTLQEGGARLDDGTLAGSVTTLDRALLNLTRWLDQDLPAVLPLVTANPARLLGMMGEMGRLVPGALADLAVLDDGLEVCLTVVGGRVVYAGPAFSGVT